MSQYGGHVSQSERLSEKDLQRQVLNVAKQFGWRTYHTWGSIHSTKGFPDLTCVRGDRLVFIELKAEKGKLSEAQAEWLTDLSCTDAEPYEIRPSDWYAGKVEEILR